MATPRDSEFETKQTPETGTESPAGNLVFPHTPDPTEYQARAGRRILIVEDDPLSLELMRIVLTKNGFDVTLASSGMEAVNVCGQAEFDLAFMDLQMPGMDGFATAARIREVEHSGRRLPIVALTASNLSGRAYEQFKTEFARILTKPFDISTLLHTIEEYTSQNGNKEAGEKMLVISDGLRHFGMDAEQFREIFSEFLASLPERLTGMEQALQAGDLEGLARRAHNLKGVSANVGAMRLAEIAAHLDESASEADSQHIEQALQEMRSAMHVLQATAPGSIETFFAATTHAMRDE